MCALIHKACVVTHWIVHLRVLVLLVIISEKYAFSLLVHEDLNYYYYFWINRIAKTEEFKHYSATLRKGSLIIQISKKKFSEIVEHEEISGNRWYQSELQSANTDLDL